MADYICELLPAMMLDENELEKKKKKEEEEDDIVRKLLGVKKSTLIVKKRWKKKGPEVRRNLRAAEMSQEKKKQLKLKEDEQGRVYLGVSAVNDGCCFSAEIRDPIGRLVCLGTSFKTPKKAASAYDKAALKFYGLETNLNFPYRIRTILRPE